MRKRTEDSPVVDHFNYSAHSLADMTVMVIDLFSSHDSCLCKIRVSRWIRTLRTSFPPGMNFRVGSLWYLLPAFPSITTFNCLPTSEELEGSPGQSNINHHPTRCIRKLLLWIRKMQELSNILLTTNTFTTHTTGKCFTLSIVTCFKYYSVILSITWRRGGLLQYVGEQASCYILEWSASVTTL